MKRFISALATLLLATSTQLMAQHHGGMLTYQVDGQDYEGYYISPSENAPLVLLIHDWDGLTDYEVKRAQMLSAMGYAVFAMDLFGKGVRPTEVKDKRQHTGELYKDRDKMRALMNGALEVARGKGANVTQAVAAGYCFGGAAVLEWARSGVDLKGFATFHGGLKTPEGQNYSATRSKVLVMHGSADTAIPLSQFAALGEQLEASSVPHEMITYSGAPHAFTVFGSPRYREEADTQSWKRFGEFLAEQL
ncbi:dienelactone hydrolase family protein [Motiliproteus sp.]|uniref:dienelactone hydrolase family protein n=1 Tax=Motiliproteus sp. TaxID=1898955 RepID=UPI003BAC4A51